MIHISYIPPPRSSRRWGPAMVYNRTGPGGTRCMPPYIISYHIYSRISYIYSARVLRHGDGGASCGERQYYI